MGIALASYCIVRERVKSQPFFLDPREVVLLLELLGAQVPEVYGFVLVLVLCGIGSA